MTNAGNSSQTNALLERVAHENGQALEELFARHAKRLQRMVRLRLDHRLRGRIRSAEVVQQVLRTASERIGEYLSHPEQSFYLWLRELAGEHLHSLHIEHLSGHSADAGQELSLYRGAMPELDAHSLAAQLLGDRSANQGSLRAESLVLLQEALNGMDMLDREVLALCHFERLTDAEVASVLGIDQGKVSVHYVRALKRLKETLKSIPGFSGKI